MKSNQDIELLNKALDEKGITTLHLVDQRLVTNLCDIIGALYRALQAKGMTEREIENLFN